MSKKTKKAIFTFLSELLTNLAAGWIAAAIAAILIEDWTTLFFTFIFVIVSSYASIFIRKKL